LKKNSDVVLLSPTGTGKTLAFLLPLLSELNRKCDDVQLLIVVPSRELAIQIEQVIREMGTGFKVNAIYGGRASSKDKSYLNHPPAILIGTPGRIADHFRRETFSLLSIKMLVLDEFDKSLEIGFETDMIEIIDALPTLKKKILTSATQAEKIPMFVGLKKPVILDFLEDKIANLKTKLVYTNDKDKLLTLKNLLLSIKNEPGIIFCNFKDTIQNVSQYLLENNIAHGCFHGDMEQNDRERSLIQFRNGSHQLIVATDLAARGIDIPEIKFIVHFQMPNRQHEFIHRNGRTARMNNKGTAYILHCKDDMLPEYIEEQNLEILHFQDSIKIEKQVNSIWTTLFISGGRGDKISKGDIAGLFIKQGKLKNEDLGIIELKQDCAFVAVHSNCTENLIKLVNNTKLKKKKIRVRFL